jgi:hypothetical protein
MLVAVAVHLRHNDGGSGGEHGYGHHHHRGGCALGLSRPAVR